MIQIEKYPCNDRRELETRERYWIETLESKLNSNIPTRTKKEYYLEHIDGIKEHKKVYRDKNRDEIKAQKKVYYEEHIDEYKEKNKEYYYHNKDEILEKAKEKITCECSAVVSKNSLSKHRKTQKHINLMISKNNPEN
jgi:hypothetical protein